MGCNCNKKAKKPLPAGSKASSQVTQAKTEKSGSGGKQTFELKLPNGKVETYGSRLEARAEQARRGGTVRF